MRETNEIAISRNRLIDICQAGINSLLIAINGVP